MMCKTMKQQRSGESGNVLFLILIAVALFAALSYAVTQSTRSGGGDANSETNLISSAQITQYPASVRTSIIRMIVSSGVTTGELRFNAPSDFAAGCGDAAAQALCVFHPNGGNATYTTAPPEVMEDNAQGEWTFNGDFEILNVGITTDDDAAGQEVIAFLPGIKQAVCSRINEELGLGTAIPQASGDIKGVDDAATLGYLRIMDNGQSLASTGDIEIGTGGDEAFGGTFDGQAFGCFQNNDADDDYVYFHVLIEQ